MENLTKGVNTNAIIDILKPCGQASKLFPGSIIRKPSGRGTSKAHTHNAQETQHI